MENKQEDSYSKLMQIFSGIEKELGEFFKGTENEYNLKYLQPFMFERMMSYFYKKVPEQAQTVYPLLLSDMNNIPQFLNIFQNTVVNIVTKAKVEKIDTITIDYVRKSIPDLKLDKNSIDNTLLNINSNWEKIIMETQFLIDEILEDSVAIGETMVQKAEIISLKKELKNKNDNEIIKYLGNTKVLYGALAYFKEISGRKEFFDYISDKMMIDILNKEYNVKYAQKIIDQMNYFLSKGK